MSAFTDSIGQGKFLDKLVGRSGWPGTGAYQHEVPAMPDNGVDGRQVGRTQGFNIDPCPANQRQVGAEDPCFAFWPKAGRDQCLQQLPMQRRQRLSSLNASPEQALARPEAGMVDGQRKGRRPDRGRRRHQIGQAGFRQIAEKSQSQVDGFRAGGSSTKADRRLSGIFAKTLGNGRGRPQGKKNAGRRRPFGRDWPALSRHVRPGRQPGPRWLPRGRDSRGARWSCP